MNEEIPKHFIEQAQDIINGKEPIDDPYIQHIVQQARRRKEEGSDLMIEIKHAEEAVVGMRERLVEIRGALKANLTDVATWLSNISQPKVVAKGDNR